MRASTLIGALPTRTFDPGPRDVALGYIGWITEFVTENSRRLIRLRGNPGRRRRGCLPGLAFVLGVQRVKSELYSSNTNCEGY